jgi:hypothetical protein
MGELISVSGQRKLAELAVKLKVAGDESKGLKLELRRGLRKTAEPMLSAVKDAVRSISIKGVRGGGRWARYAHRPRAKSLGLRDSVADAMMIQARMGGHPSVRIRVNTSKLPQDQRKLPRYMNRAEGWRHPVFGDKDVWAQQTGQPYWENTLIPFGPQVRSEIIDVVETVLRKIQ